MELNSIPTCEGYLAVLRLVTAETTGGIAHICHCGLNCEMNTALGVIGGQVKRVDRNTVFQPIEPFESNNLGWQ
jgi:hypothetical protein